MSQAELEPYNYSTADLVKTAQTFVDLFVWEIRGQGSAMGTEYKVHIEVGTQYLPLYCPPEALA